MIYKKERYKRYAYSVILNVKYWFLLIDSLKPCCELESTREASCPQEP